MSAPTESQLEAGTANPTRSETSGSSSSISTVSGDPLSLSKHRRVATTEAVKADHPDNHKRAKKFYKKQNALIDMYLNAHDEERQAIEDHQNNSYKVKLAVNASFGVNFCLFCIQVYAAASTGSLALFAMAADAFMDLVSSIVMLITSRLARKPNIEKYPVGRTRIETMGIVIFCALMSTVAVQLIVESGRKLDSGGDDSEELDIIPLTFVSVAIGCKFLLFIYCFLLRRYPAAYIFYIDHRNDMAINIFGLLMAVFSRKLGVWYLDPIGAILIALIILSSWASTAFEHIFLLIGKSAPQEFLNKLVYMAVTHDSRILKVDTARAYHSGERYYVEVDIVMDENTILKVSHDVAEELQKKYEGLKDVERAFVHVDWEHHHHVHGEHKSVVVKSDKKGEKKRLRNIFGAGKKDKTDTESPSGGVVSS